MSSRLSTLLMLLAIGLPACGDPTSSQVESDETASNPLPPVNGSDGEAFTPMFPEFGGLPDKPKASRPPGYQTSYPSRVDDPPPPVPEPGTLLLVGTGLAGLTLYRRRRQRAATDS